MLHTHCLRFPLAILSVLCVAHGLKPVQDNQPSDLSSSEQAVSPSHPLSSHEDDPSPQHDPILELMLSQSPRVLDRDSQAGSQAGPIRHASASKEAAHAQEVAEASVFERAVEHIIDSSTPGHEHEHAVEHTNEHDVVEARPGPNKVSVLKVHGEQAGAGGTRGAENNPLTDTAEHQANLTVRARSEPSASTHGYTQSSTQGYSEIIAAIETASGFSLSTALHSDSDSEKGLAIFVVSILSVLVLLCLGGCGLCCFSVWLQRAAHHGPRKPKGKQFFLTKHTNAEPTQNSQSAAGGGH